MKTVLLAGGLGTRLAEETHIKPKPMVEIGGRPILWHIMNIFAHHGYDEFMVALGYKGEYIKQYFRDYAMLSGNMTVGLKKGEVAPGPGSKPGAEDWTIHLMDTGASTNTGGRVKRLQPHLNETFMVTYGDGVANVDVKKLVEFHKSHGKIATMTAVRPPARFGSILFEGDQVKKFAEKPQTGEGWINGGFLVLEPAIFDYLDGDSASLESGAMERLAAAGQLMAYKHDGFWQCMDTLRDKNQLEALWGKGAPWRVWS